MPRRTPLTTLKTLFRSSPGPSKPPVRRGRRTAQRFLERLEERCLLSYMVTNTSPSATTSGSLGYEIGKAIAGTQPAVITFSIPANSTIMFTSSSEANSAAAEYGPTAYFVSGNGTNITIDGSGAPGLVIDGGGSVRLFTVASDSSLTLENLTLQDGDALGGAGAAAAAAGLGWGARSLITAAVSRLRGAPSPTTRPRAGWAATTATTAAAAASGPTRP